MATLPISTNIDLSQGETVARVAEKYGWTEPMVWSMDRSTGAEGLTLTGLLMLGLQRSILDHLPYFHLDYRHLPSTDISNASRWLDRVTLDGLWAGNLFEFYRKVITKLRDGLQIPFKMGPDLFRRDETPQHEALREATVNTLIHADYQGRRGIRIFRLPHGFEGSVTNDRLQELTDQHPRT